MLLALVDAGFGAALLPEAAARLQFPNVQFRPLQAASNWMAKLNMIWHPENENPALERFLSHA